MPSGKFPTLEPFADLIYDGAGETFVRKEDSTWVIIKVNEGFSQGCPASPVFAAIVLHDILSRIIPELESRAAHRKLNNNGGNDGHGSIGFILWHTSMTSTASSIMKMLNMFYNDLRH
ncbi:hypothetical protein ACHAXN_009488 [Cyclotella atomus]